MKMRKLFFAVMMVGSTTLLALFDKITGGNIVAIYCALIPLFNIANAVEYVTKSKGD